MPQKSLFAKSLHGLGFQLLDLLGYASGLKPEITAILNQKPFFEKASNIFWKKEPKILFNLQGMEEYMAKLKKFMVVHRDMAISWDNVEKNWAKLAKVNAAKWIRTSFNKKKGIRYCLWESPSEKHLKEIFRNINSGWESILEVEETAPNQWGEN